MAWYESRGIATYVATYKDEKVMRWEVEQAAKFGWAPQNTAAVGGHINMARTAGPALLTGGLSLMFGASRSKDKLTVTFVRDQRIVAKDRVEDADGAVKQHAARLRAAFDQACTTLSALHEQLTASRAAEANRESVEKAVLKSTKQVVECEEGLIKAYDHLVTLLAGLDDAYSFAASVGVGSDGPTIETQSEIASIKQCSEFERGRWSVQKELRTTQEAIVSMAKRWDKALENKRKNQARLAEDQGRIQQLQSELEGQTGQAEKLTKKIRDAETEMGKHDAETLKWSAEQESCRASLTDLFGRRDELLGRMAEYPLSLRVPEPVSVSMRSSAVADQFSASEPKSEASSDALAQIQKLAELHVSGALTDDEFAAKKADLLSRL